MDVSLPLTAVVPSLDGPVLTVLERTNRPLTGRQVHRLAGAGSEAGVRRVLTRLTEHGLVDATRAGAALLYLANREHMAWPAVEILTGLSERLVDRLCNELAAWPISPLTAVLFGSAARRDGNVDSDIDLLIISPEDGATQLDEVTLPASSAWEVQLAELRERVTAWTGNRCQIYNIGTQEFAVHVVSREAVVTQWRRDGVHLYGEPLEQLIRHSVGGRAG